MLQIRYNDEVKVAAVEDVNNPSVILSELPTDTIYNIRVSATNNAGEGSYSNIITTNTLSKSMYANCLVDTIQLLVVQCSIGDNFMYAFITAATGGAIKGRLLFQIRLILDASQSCQAWMVSYSCS